MNQRTLLSRLLSPAGFGLVLLLFLMPFVTVSCGNETSLDATFTGMDMIVGGQPTITGDVGGEPVDAELESELNAIFADDLDLQPLAVLAVLGALFGMATGLVGQREARAASSAILAVTTGVLISAAMLGVAGEVSQAMAARTDLWGDSPPPTAVHPQYGYWLVIVILVALAALNAVVWAHARRMPAGEPEWYGPGSPDPAQGGTGQAAPDILDYRN